MAAKLKRSVVAASCISTHLAAQPTTFSRNARDAAASQAIRRSTAIKSGATPAATADGTTFTDTTIQLRMSSQKGDTTPDCVSVDANDSFAAQQEATGRRRPQRKDTADA